MIEISTVSEISKQRERLCFAQFHLHKQEVVVNLPTAGCRLFLRRRKSPWTDEWLNSRSNT